jgi:hypothetical protein
MLSPLGENPDSLEIVAQCSQKSKSKNSHYANYGAISDLQWKKKRFTNSSTGQSDQSRVAKTHLARQRGQRPLAGPPHAPAAVPEKSRPATITRRR